MSETYVTELTFGNQSLVRATESGTGFIRRTLVIGASVFDPSSLFTSGKLGAWYDPSDLSTLFQDSAGTTPVTADGQSVGKIVDKSGNGNHLTASGAARPLYKTSSGLSWLLFDGASNVVMTASGRTWAATSDFYTAVRATAVNNMMFTDSPISSWLGAMESGGFASPPCSGVGAPIDIVNGVTVSPDNRDNFYNLMAGMDKLYEADNATIAYGTAGIGVIGSFIFNGRLYGMIICSNVNSSSRASVRTWLGAKAGLSL